MATDDKSSPTLDSANDLPRSPASPSHLTHFKPLTPDQDEPPFKSAYSSFVNLFRFNKERGEGGQGEQQSPSSSWASPQIPSRTQSVRSPVPYKKQLNEELHRRSSVLGKTAIITLCV